MKIALLEDDKEQAALITAWLNDASFDVNWFEDGESLIKRLRTDVFDIAIFDWELPRQSGLEVLAHLRNVLKNEIPVLFTTQRDSEADIVRALQQGADDYLSKPLRQAELLARLEALRRRSGVNSQTDIIRLGFVEIDTKKSEIFVEGKQITITQKDYGLARELFSHLGRILSREYLLKSVWGVNADINTRTVDVHVCRIRKTLKIYPENGYRIKSIFQHGYRLEKC